LIISDLKVTLRATREHDQPTIFPSIALEAGNV
jgi:hypothetical protein